MGSPGPRPEDSAAQATLMEGQRRLLEQLAQGLPTEALLDHLCLLVESLATSATCSLLMLGQDGRSIHHSAGPGFPTAFLLALGGTPPIGPKQGSCGMTAFENRMTICEDIAADPLWDGYRAAALAHGLEACVSLPISAPDGGELGTFALYHHHPGPFEPFELALLEAATGLASLVVRIHRRDDALRRGETKYRRPFDGIPNPAWTFDPRSLAFIEVNQAAVELYGWSREEFTRKTLEDIWTPSAGQELRPRLADIGPDEVIKGQFQHRTKGGALIDVEITSNGIELEGRGLRLTVVRDITDRRVAEDRIRKSEARYRAVVEQAGDMIFLFDVATKRIVEANAAFQKSLGYSDEDVETLTLYDLVEADPESVDRNISHVVAEHHYAVGRRRYRRKDGRFLVVEVSANYLRELDQDLICAVARDVTDQTRNESAVRQAQKLESLGVLAGGIAHDFNNLLTAILGNLSLAQLKLAMDSPVVPYLRKIESTVLRASDLTRQMLAYSGKGRFMVQAVDLGKLVEEMTHLLEVSIPKMVVLGTYIPAGLPAMEADPIQIQQVVMNLVINAAEAIGDQEGSISLSARSASLDEAFIARHLPRQAVNPGPYVILEVADTGCGMSPETLARIFDPFFTTKVSGRGLGLSAMLGILRGHLAGISIYSELGRGSTFRIYFPARESIVKVPESPNLPVRAALPTGTILVVDDESAIRATACAMLESLGFKVLEAADGLEAVEFYRAHQSEVILVLLDLTMPHMDGRDAFQAIHALNPSAKVILSSGYNQQEAIQPFAARGLAGFLQKPYQYRDLKSALEKILLEKP